MSDAAKPAKAPVIQIIRGAELTAGERLLNRILPACAASAMIHAGLAGGVALLSYLNPPTVKASEPDKVAVAVEEKPEKPSEVNLTDQVEVIDDSNTTVSIENAKLDETTVFSNEIDKGPAGQPDSNDTNVRDILGAIGNPGNDAVAGLTNLSAGDGALGSGNLGMGMIDQSLKGRGESTTKQNLLKTGGGTVESEASVAMGLAWLSKKQKTNGNWVHDGTHDYDTVSATGLGLLPFLAAGQTHKPKDKASGKYKLNVQNAIKYLLATQQADGSFRDKDKNGQLQEINMYSNAIATVALCEAYGMTGDKALLHEPVTRAVKFIQKAQGKNGSWGYKPGDDGDTSIVGWQIQALHSAKLCQDVKVDSRVLDKAMKFLDSVASGSSKYMYGYSEASSKRASLTAVGLLCRYYLNGWGPNSAGLRDGVDYLMKEQMPGEKTFDMYYYYYATQVLHFMGGDAWLKEWNPKMRDFFIKTQVKDESKPNVNGSWDADKGSWIGPSCGRHGTTCFVLLSLEVYYRHLPLYGRGTGGKSDLEMK